MFEILFGQDHIIVFHMPSVDFLSHCFVVTRISSDGHFQVRLMISDSEHSDDFSLDTVGSHGDVKCKGRFKDYLV